MGPLQSTQIGTSAAQDSSSAPPDQSFDLFDPTQQKSPTVEAAASKIRELREGVRRSPRHTYCHFKTNKVLEKKSPLTVPESKVNVSSEDLWTDEELFNDSFLQATQDLVDDIKTPKGMKHKANAGTPEGTLPKKAGRFTFSLDPVAVTTAVALATVTNIVKNSAVAPRPASVTCDASACKPSTAVASCRDLNIGAAVKVPSPVNSSISQSTTSCCRDRSGPATRSTALRDPAFKAGDFGANDNKRQRSSGQRQSEFPQPAKALPFRVNSKLQKQDCVTAGAQQQDKSASGRATAPSAGATMFVFQQRSRASSCSSSSTTASQLHPSSLPVKPAAVGPAANPWGAAPSVVQPGGVTTNPAAVAKRRSLVSAYPAKESSRSDSMPPESAVKTCSSGKKSDAGQEAECSKPAAKETVKDTSISEDLLATLVEPDDLLDSQVYMESSQVSPLSVGATICDMDTVLPTCPVMTAKLINCGSMSDTSGKKGQDQKCQRGMSIVELVKHKCYAL